ncbi:MAG TPA: hypothetical protein VFE82_14295 [Ramlibacter sp.]|jgi:hypothetical protein|uniref:hypothetical protein n=1 Tax=Ramlibacter sp. TaxID=1917967 RepID=UPI002D39EBBC|nr:hypothetical protein [Ramlibacter sp.]HZY19643.1 hypothetical protein [Ramlibacter sp.]
MAFTVTSSGRQLAMAVLLALAVAGAVIRAQAPDPSTWHDIGTLLLVLWIPAVGNLIAFLVRQLPRRAPPPLAFAHGTPFTPHAQAALAVVDLPPGFIASLDPQEARGTVITGRRGYTVRLDRPLAQWLADPGPQPVALEFLLPQVALRELQPDVQVHLLAGTTAIAKGRLTTLAATR